MDKEVERELLRLERQITDVKESLDKQDVQLQQLAKDIMRFWHLGLGIGLGLLIKELGLETLLSKFL